MVDWLDILYTGLESVFPIGIRYKTSLLLDLPLH